MQNPEEILNAALEYASRGWAVFPCVAGGKIPATPDGFYSATNDPEKVDKLFRKYPNSNIGLATGDKSGLFAIDIDIKNNAQGDISWLELIKTYGEIPHTIEAVTWSGGRHILFKFPENKAISCKTAIRPGIDVKSQGGYIIVAPSTVEGKKYSWELSCLPEYTLLAEAPEWLLNLIKETGPEPDSLEVEMDIVEGRRNTTLTQIGGKLRSVGLSSLVINEALQNINLKACIPPLQREEVTKIAQSVSRYKARLLESAVESSLGAIPVRQLPLSLAEFLKQDFPSVEYYAEGILQKQGRAMISASANTGKSFFLQNLALAIATGQDKFLGKFSIKQGRVLYIDLEMGNSPLKERFQKMCESTMVDNLFLQYATNFDLLDKIDQQSLEGWILGLKIDVLMIDPIGDAWQGNENEKQEVGKVTSYLNTLKDKFKISILISHHWKKKTKDMKGGGEMASGSYKWGAWLDHHIALDGNKWNLTLSCEKSRNSSRFEPFMIKLNEETLWFEFLTDFTKKFNEQTLISVFESFNKERVSVPELCKKVKEQSICSDDTLRKLIKESKAFEVDKSGKCHIIYKKEDQNNLFTSENGVDG